MPRYQVSSPIGLSLLLLIGCGHRGNNCPDSDEVIVRFVDGASNESMGWALALVCADVLRTDSAINYYLIRSCVGPELAMGVPERYPDVQYTLPNLCFSISTW